jgi:signal transduction histidine kinase
MSVIEKVPRMFTVRAQRRSTVLKIGIELFEEVLVGSPAAALALLRLVMARLRTTESMLGQQARLVSLGTLAAGLAHELNNPAAAAQRGVGQLRRTVTAWLQARSDLDALRLAPEVNDRVLARLRQDIEHDSHPGPVAVDDPLERSDREEAVCSWLEGQGIEDAWDLAPGLAACGWDVAALHAWCSGFETAQVPAILRWLTMGYHVHNLLDEIHGSTERISEIVRAVKNYSVMDQAPLLEIDVHDGLESTLVILKHKLKQGITVRRDYDRTLPRIDAYAGELNQLWTNLMDNAIDAMQGNGELRLRTYMDDGQVAVEIGDNGPGIPAHVLPRIFEPFFTTKGPGQGTGLGLHVSHGIVQKHRGKIEVHSEPGDTRFKVSLPLSRGEAPGGDLRDVK